MIILLLIIISIYYCHNNPFSSPCALHVRTAKLKNYQHSHCIASGIAHSHHLGIKTTEFLNGWHCIAISAIWCVVAPVNIFSAILSITVVVSSSIGLSLTWNIWINHNFFIEFSVVFIMYYSNKGTLAYYYNNDHNVI